MENLKKYLKKSGVLYIPLADGDGLSIQTKNAAKVEQYLSRYYPSFTVNRGTGYFADISTIRRI